jgi:hypothetical protein
VRIARLEPALYIQGSDQELAEVLRAVTERLAFVKEQARGEEVIEKVGHGLGLELGLLAREGPPAVEAAPERFDGLDDDLQPQLGRRLRPTLEPAPGQERPGLLAQMPRWTSRATMGVAPSQIEPR